MPPAPPLLAPFTQRFLVRAKLPPVPRGTCRTVRVVPLPAPPVVITAPFYPKTQPVRAPVPQPARGGQVASNPGAPLRNPGTGPQVSAGQPAGIRVIFLRQGDVQQTAAPAVPPPPVIPPVFVPAAFPARARITLPLRGRAYSGPGGPLRNPGTGPVSRQADHPATARFPLPARGRTGSNPGTLPPAPPVPAKVYPQAGPARIRITLPPRGRTAFNEGAPARNPNPGPAFRQAVRPVRGIIPQNAPRGRTGSNPGGPVIPVPAESPDFTFGIPYLGWDTGTPYTGCGQAASGGTPAVIPGFSSVPGAERPGACQPGRAGTLAYPPPLEFAFGEPYISWATGTPYT